jgi:aspartyl-tRNA(Asn)/glutamyl-tRNA(Gln) amidotransferase subunit C
MKIDEELVKGVAKLAALELSAEETGAMARHLTRIVEHFEALRAVPDELLGGTPEPLETPLRADVPIDCSPGPLVFSNAPEHAHGHFVVPRVVSRDG